MDKLGVMIKHDCMKLLIELRKNNFDIFETVYRKWLSIA